MQRFLPLLFLLMYSLPAAWADTVLVLPFFNHSSSPSLDWISESVSQTVREALASRGMLVAAREDREEAYRRLSIRSNAHLTHASVIKVAEEVDANDVIYGQFEYTPPQQGAAAGARGSLQITAFTLDMRRMRKGPEFLESGPLDDLAGLQTHLAWQLLRYLDPSGTPEAAQFMEQRPAVRLDAMESYIRGLLAKTPEQKHRYFTQAARLDDHFPQPRFELGRLYWAQKEYRFAADWFAKVMPGTPRSMEATFHLGLCRYYMNDFAGAQQAFELVARSVPLNEVYNDLGAAQSRRDLPEALDNFRKALEGDPADPDYHFNAGYALWKRGEFDAAAEHFRAVLERNSDDAKAKLLVERCIQRSGPRPADRKNNFERVKLNYEEGAWRQLKEALEAKPKGEH